MKIKLSTKRNKLLMGLGTVALVAGLTLNSSIVKADDTSDSSNQATIDQTQLNQHKDLQAYNNPLTAQEVTTTVGQLPDPEAGVANWSSLPAGTTAVWNMNPDISKAGLSYGQIIVTFPDGSASALAVDVNTTDGSTANDDSTMNTNSDSQTSNVTNDTEAKNTDASQASDPVTISNVNGGDGQVISKDNANVSEAIAPKTESAVIENEASHVAGDGALPQTNSKTSMITIISGVMLALVGLAGLVTVKERN